MRPYLRFSAVLAAGITIGAGFQQLRIDDLRVFWQNSLTRYYFLETAYRSVCLPLEQLESAVEAVGLSSQAIAESSDSRVNLVFVQTGSVEPFTKDLGNMKFHLNTSKKCVSLGRGE